ncbi:MAG: UDP-2,3-diacylglucosamine diphosphatase LpxI [Verrucomicrobiales bacterium]|nr:UDP-2,3-diacylglucosamine diphosphatase LpxI [Verrucomicrobiales bacterium]
MRFPPGWLVSQPPLGLIAGSKSLPLLFAREARRDGRRIVAVAAEGETSPDLENLVDEIVWLRVGQLGRMIDAFKERGVEECVMLGQLAPKNLFEIRPDFRAMSLLFKIKEKNAHTLFGAVADELKKEGVTLIEPLKWLGPWLPSSGYLVGPKLTQEQMEDVNFGLKLAKEVSRLEIGQSVVVKKGTILAVEAFEGTDGCLQRGGQLAGREGGAIVVKVAKDGHDLRFDIPCIGPRTIEVCRKSGIAVVAIEAERTLLLDQPEMEELAKRSSITITAVRG